MGTPARDLCRARRSQSGVHAKVAHGWAKISQDQPRRALAGECGGQGARREKRGPEVGMRGALPLREQLGCSELQLVTETEHSPRVPLFPPPHARCSARPGVSRPQGAHSLAKTSGGGGHRGSSGPGDKSGGDVHNDGQQCSATFYMDISRGPPFKCVTFSAKERADHDKAERGSGGFSKIKIQLQQTEPHVCLLDR